MSYAPPAPSNGEARPLPDGWIEELDASTGRTYYIDTLTLNPKATWDDPRENPALYTDHDPDMGVTVTSIHLTEPEITVHVESHSNVNHQNHQERRDSIHSQYSGASTPLPGPKQPTVTVNNTAVFATHTGTLPAPKVYPNYVPKTSSSPLFTITGALVAGGMLYRSTRS